MFPTGDNSGIFRCNKCGHIHYVQSPPIPRLIPFQIRPIKCPKCGSLKQVKDKKVLF